MRDAEFVFVVRIERGGFFEDAVNHGAARAFFQSGQKPEQMFLRADGVGFYAAVAKIADVTGEAQTFGGILREVSKADALDETGYEESFGLFFGAHRVRKL